MDSRRVGGIESSDGAFLPCVVSQRHSNSSSRGTICGLQEVLHRLKMGNRGRETKAQEGVQQFWNRHGWVLESLPLTANRVTDGSWGEVIQVGYELIRMLDLDPESVEHFLWEISDVVRDDDTGL